MAELKPCQFCGGRLGVANEGHKDDCYIMLLVHRNAGPHEFNAAWKATDGQRAGVPEGWKLVPVEPTIAMVEAGENARKSEARPWAAHAMYAAMLAAAPTPPAGDAGQEPDRRDAERYAYVLDCEVVAARKYLPNLDAEEFKAKRRAAHDAAIAASKEEKVNGQ
ncbi:hypothetical protein [Cupriavidus gilardii]|uniref:hypothetical protein n=1 Tax=Cupriavidus gilardii TaxID=82541 RepID=UPI0021B2D655|nr:hypothetical protein [Cupriavidus gilardii]UXC38239.1 hypothetical protein N4G38_24575 [Cupriavidus gilardii]